MRGFRTTILLICLSALPACGGITGPGSTENYQAAHIFATWSGGRTGTPLDESAETPVVYLGSLCPPNSLVVENWASDTLGSVRVTNNCTITVTIIACVASGSGAALPPDSGLRECAQDPKQTPMSNFTTNTIFPRTRQVVGVTNKNLALNIYWCSDETHLGYDPVHCFKF